MRFPIKRFVKRFFVPAFVLYHAAPFGAVIIEPGFHRLFAASFKPVGEYLIHHAATKPRGCEKIRFVYGQLVSGRRFGIRDADPPFVLAFRPVINDALACIDREIIPVDTRLMRGFKTGLPEAVVQRHHDILMKPLAGEPQVDAAYLA